MIPEKIEVLVPDEPPTGSVVVDKDGLAWQCIGPSLLSVFSASAPWCAAVKPQQQPRSVSWTYLLAHVGPVTLVHRGEVRKRDIPLDMHGWTPACTCHHEWEDHRRGGGACTQLDSYGFPCACPSYDRDPNEDDEEKEPSP